MTIADRSRGGEDDNDNQIAANSTCSTPIVSVVSRKVSTNTILMLMGWCKKKKQSWPVASADCPIPKYRMLLCDQHARCRIAEDCLCARREADSGVLKMSFVAQFNSASKDSAPFTHARCSIQRAKSYPSLTTLPMSLGEYLRKRRLAYFPSTRKAYKKQVQKIHPSPLQPVLHSTQNLSHNFTHTLSPSCLSLLLITVNRSPPTRRLSSSLTVE